MSSLQQALDNKLAVTRAIGRLVKIALRDTGQSRKAANFLLAWWNAIDNGGFDLTDMWGVDREIADDMILVFSYVAHNNHYANEFGYQDHMGRIWELWRKPAS